MKADRVIHVSKSTKQRFLKVMKRKGYIKPNDFIVRLLEPIEEELKKEG